MQFTIEVVCRVKFASKPSDTGIEPRTFYQKSEVSSIKVLVQSYDVKRYVIKPWQEKSIDL